MRMLRLTREEYNALNERKKSKNKYHAQKIVVDGITFDSKREAQRYHELKLMQAGGLIEDLQVHVPFYLKLNNILLSTYEADFVYNAKELTIDGVWRWADVVEDVKGVRTREYQIKKRLMKALHGIEIREIGRGKA